MPTKKIGKYEILRELGRGAMGVVFKARDPHIGRLVALKTIALAASQSDDLRQRFYREAQAAGSLQHPNIVTVYEMGEENGVPFIAMEYLEGESLDGVLSKNTQIPVAQKLGYLVQVCRALSYAHQHGIVHRDMKPGNIVVTRDGAVKVVDFGIARMMDTSKTQTGVLLGTLAYMSPQLVKGERADERSDIWAVGVVSYELFAGLKPFDGENHAALLLSIVSDEPKPLETVAPDCPNEVRVIVERMLRKNVAQRYQCFEELLRAVEPVWRKHQRECVDSMLAQSRDLVRGGELPEARKVLIQARLVDGTRTLTREMLEEVNAVLKDKRLPAEVEERLERARNLRSEGLLEEARAAARSALDLDSKSESARKIVAEITREVELLDETKKSRRAAALERLLTAMRTAIQRGDPSDAIRLGREALGRAGDDTRVSELIELAERRLREEGRRLDREKPGDVEIELYPKGGEDSEKLIRQYVFERVGAQRERSDSSLPEVNARQIEAARRSATSRLHSDSASAASGLETTARKQAAQRSGTMVLTQPTDVSRAHASWKKLVLYIMLAAGAAGVAILSIERIRPRAKPVPVQTAAVPTNQTSAENQPKAPTLPPPSEVVERATPEKNESELFFEQAKRLATNDDSASLRQAAHLLERVIAANGPHRAEAEQLRDSLLQRFSKDDQALQRNQQVASLATEARRDLDAGNTAGAWQKLSDIRKLGGEDENLAAEIARTERARFATLESEYQQDAQSADERARSHLADLQRQFRALASGGGPMAENAKNYAENLIPAKIAEIAAKTATAKSNPPENREFDNAVKEYKRFVEARDANSLKNIVLPRFQAIAQGGTSNAAEAGQYVDKLIPAAIRQLAPFPTIGCAEVPSGLRPSVKAGDLVACGLLDAPRLSWVQFTWPEFPAQARQAGQVKGIAMLILTVDENGNILEAKPRGHSDAFGFMDTAIQASRNWKTNAPRMEGKPVRTQFSVDIPFSNN